MSIGAMEIIAGIAMAVILYLVPGFVAHRVQHGEARFDKDGKLIEDE